MKYSFLLVNFNMAPLVTRAARSIAGNVPEAEPYEILVADNSTDPLSRLTEGSIPSGLPVRLVPLGENRGFVDALNRIIPLAAGELVVIMHPDVELAPGCVRGMAEFLAAHPGAGVVAPDIYYPDGRPNKIRLEFPSVRSAAKRFWAKIRFIVTRREAADVDVVWDRSTDVTADMVMSVCLMARGAALRELGAIDPRLVFYYSNDYLCGRMRQSGWTCHYTTAARAVHFERYTPREQYSGSAVMDYKQDAVAANPRMRADYFVFLAGFYPPASRAAFRALALLEDLTELLAQLKHPIRGKHNISRLSRSALVDLGLGR